MRRHLDVLVIESQRGAGRAAARALTAAGHSVERCFGEYDSGFPCCGLVDPGTCPVDGPVDAALVVRRQPTPRPTPLEQGVTCAVRAGVPVVEVTPRTSFDPFGGWPAARAEPGADVVALVESAAEMTREQVGRAVLAVVAPLLVDEAMDPSAVVCNLQRDGRRLNVRIHLPGEASPALRHQVAVRALSAVRGLLRGNRLVGIAVSSAEAAA
jgi:hypothetical protein